MHKLATQARGQEIVRGSNPHARKRHSCGFTRGIQKRICDVHRYSVYGREERLVSHAGEYNDYFLSNPRVITNANELRDIPIASVSFFSVHVRHVMSF